MREQAAKNKTAWKYRAYEFWNNQGTPKEIAEQLKTDPPSKLKFHQKYFKNIRGDYFNSRIFNEDEQSSFPDCSLRFYTLSEIINAVIRAGFIIKEFNEHPNYENEKLPGLFTICAME